MRADPGLRQHQPVLESRLAHLSLAAALVPAPVPERAGVRVQRHDRPVRPAAGRRAPAAQLGRLLLDSRRSGGGRRAARPEQPGAERDARELHLGPARPEEQPVRPEGNRLRAQRLADLGDLVGRAARRQRHGGQFGRAEQRLHRRVQLRQRRRQPEPDRLARLRRARRRHQRSGQGLQRRTCCGNSTPRPSAVRRWAASAWNRGPTT